MTSKCPDCFGGYITITTAYNQTHEICSTCEGSGTVAQPTCSRCNGSGLIEGYRTIIEHRDGNGRIQSKSENSSFEDCPNCNGSGYLD